MLDWFIPDGVFRDVTDIPESWFLSRGIEGIVLDIDNTIAKYSEILPPKSSLDWLGRIRDAGIKAVVVSNNKHSGRVQKMSEAMGVRYIYRASKPSKKGFEWAAKAMGIPLKKIAAIGDQIFTDICGAKRSGCYAVIVYPRGIDENFLFRLRRAVEIPFISVARKKVEREK